MPVRSLGQENPLENEMAAHSRILAWEIPRTKPGELYSPQGHKESDTTEQAPTQLNRALSTSWDSPPSFCLCALVSSVSL